MARTKEPYTVTGPSKDPAKHNKPWCSKWHETVTDKSGTKEVRKSKWFPSKATATAWGKQKEHDRLYSDIRQLSDNERAMYLHFVKECESRGLDPHDVFDAGLHHFHADKVQDMPLEDAQELMAVWMMSEQYSPKTISGMDWSLNWLIRKTDGNRLVSSFTSSDIVTIVKGRYDNHTSQESFLRNLKSFFSWAAQQGYCSPLVAKDAALDKHRRRTSAAKSANRRTHKRPQRLTVNQIETIFETVDTRFHPVFALGIFAGLRPESELMRIEWSRIDGGHFYGLNFEERVINMHESWVTKTFMERTITDLPDVFWNITERHRSKGRITPVTYSHYRKLALDPIKKALGWKVWPKDVMRHSMCSFDYVRIGKELAMKNAGHKVAATFDTHYLNSVSGSEAAAYAALDI